MTNQVPTPFSSPRIEYNTAMSLHSSIQRIPFTQSAFEKMQAEYEHLLVEEQALIERVNTAKAQGDLSENGAYKYGKIELAGCRRRLRELNYLLVHAEIIDTKTNKTTEIADFGCTITLKNNSKTLKFMLVSKYEADPSNQKLSDQSPMGSAVKGKSVGDTVTVRTPSGDQQYVIDAIT